MKKILKCVLAFALLSMVFTSTVLAEGSITADNLGPIPDDSSIVLTTNKVDSISTPVAKVNNAFDDVQEETKGFKTKLSALDAATRTNLKIADFSTEAVITPFIDITLTSGTIPAGGARLTVKLNSSILNDAKLIRAIHITSTGDVEVLDAVKSGTDSVVFTTNSFSPFAFLIEYNTHGGSGSSSSSTSTGKTPVVNTAAGEVNHTNYMAYATVASVLAVGAIIIASKKLAKNAK